MCSTESDNKIAEMQAELDSLRKRNKELEEEKAAQFRREQIKAEQMDMKEAIAMLRGKYGGDYVLLALSKTQGDVVEAAVCDKEAMKGLLQRLTVTL